MKKLLFVFVLGLVLVFATNAMAINWVTANEKTIGWDIVTTMVDGTPVPEGDVVQYKIWLSNAITDPNKLNPSELPSTEALEYTITLNVEGQYLPGVQAIRVVGGEIVSNSTISWSDDPDVCLNGETFGIRHFLGLMKVMGMFAK